MKSLCCTLLRRGGCLTAAAVVVLTSAMPAAAQYVDREMSLTGGAARLERPEGLAVSPGGDQIALCDAQANRIVVFDYQGVPLWTAGDRINLRRPKAAAFLSTDRLLFVSTETPYVFSLDRTNPAAVDTIADLTWMIEDGRTADQLLPTEDGGWLLLDESQGEIIKVNADWEFDKVLVRQGSGKGKVLLPTALTRLSNGNIVVTDRENYPAQTFSRTGRLQFYFGWGAPGEARGWEAVAVAQDARDIIWIADETESVFRRFDNSGNEIGTVPYPNPLFRPIAMTATVDNRMLVVDRDGRAVFYTLQ